LSAKGEFLIKIIGKNTHNIQSEIYKNSRCKKIEFHVKHVGAKQVNFSEKKKINVFGKLILQGSENSIYTPKKWKDHCHEGQEEKKGVRKS
jgi:hypothetical protein